MTRCLRPIRSCCSQASTSASVLSPSLRAAFRGTASASVRRSPAASTLIAPSVVRPCCFRGMVCQGDPRASCSDARSTRSAAPLLAVGLPQRTRSRNHHATLMVGTPCVVRRRGAAASTAIVADAAATAASTVHAATHLVRSSCCFVRRRQGSQPRHEPTAPHSTYARPLWWTMAKMMTTDDV